MSNKQTTPNPKRLKALIEGAGYTVSQFSDLVFDNTDGSNRTRNIVSELERRPDMRSSTLFRICKLLNCNMEALFGDTDFCQCAGTESGTRPQQLPSDPQSQILFLKQEVAYLQKLVHEKDMRISELKQHSSDIISRLDILLDNRQENRQ